MYILLFSTFVIVFFLSSFFKRLTRSLRFMTRASAKLDRSRVNSEDEGH